MAAIMTSTTPEGYSGLVYRLQSLSYLTVIESELSVDNKRPPSASVRWSVIPARKAMKPITGDRAAAHIGQQRHIGIRYEIEHDQQYSFECVIDAMVESH